MTGNVVVTAAMIRPGEFELRVDGEPVGSLSLLDTVPGTGRALWPTVAAGNAAAALADLYNATVDAEMRFRAQGWANAVEYQAQIEATRSVTANLPAPVRAEVATAWARHGWTQPISREQMTAWQDEVLDIVTAHDPDPAEHEPGTAA